MNSKRKTNEQQLHISEQKNKPQTNIETNYNIKKSIVHEQLKGLSFLVKKYVDFNVHNKWLLRTKIISKDKNITTMSYVLFIVFKVKNISDC